MLKSFKEITKESHLGVPTAHAPCCSLFSAVTLAAWCTRVTVVMLCEYGPQALEFYIISNHCPVCQFCDPCLLVNCKNQRCFICLVINDEILMTGFGVLFYKTMVIIITN